MTKETAGKVALELQKKTPDSRDPIELQREMQKDYMDNLIECVEEFRKHSSGNFFVVVLTKKEKHLQNILRNMFLARFSCPTPTCDQAVFRYNAEDDAIEFLWSLPDLETCEMFRQNFSYIVKDEQELAETIKKFHSGELDKLADSFNSEK